ncbi:MAG TPA: YiiX/YebB-like N1pC/P60 family cysteine hydrolase [Chitinophagaceae bacterium]|nr:YiiX/YebB-like N1pC/P60 family cysteine hydrolase [Chitinophagaceae bacterium]
MKTVLWICVAALSFAACGSKEETADSAGSDLGIKSAEERLAANLSMVAEVKKNIRDGDMILRTGNDFSSGHIRDISAKDKTYSHGGIAVREGEDVYIYHIDTEFGHSNDKVRKEILDSFCNPLKSLGFGHARYALDSAENKAFVAYMEKQYHNKTPFDLRFDVKTDDSMYCSEMIMKGLRAATNNRVQIETIRFYGKDKYKVIKQYLKIPESDFVGRHFVPVDHLYVHPDCQVLKRYVFE